MDLLLSFAGRPTVLAPNSGIPLGARSAAIATTRAGSVRLMRDEFALLRGVAEEDVAELTERARRRRFAAGEVVFHAGDPADTLHLVRSGRFAVRITTEFGSTATLNVVGPGGAFGELALLTPDAPRSATVAALEEAETLSIHQLDFNRLRTRRPQTDALLVGGARRARTRAVRAARRGAAHPRRHARAAAPARRRRRLRGDRGGRRRAAHAGGAGVACRDIPRHRQQSPARGAGARNARALARTHDARSTPTRSPSGPADRSAERSHQAVADGPASSAASSIRHRGSQRCPSKRTGTSVHAQSPHSSTSASTAHRSQSSSTASIVIRT